MHSVRAGHIVSALLAVTTGLAACGDPTEPNMLDVSGTYVATTLLVTENGQTTNQLSAGATISMILTREGGTTGQIFVPHVTPDETDFTASLVGFWTLDRDIVEFNQTSDTFIRDMPFTFSDNTLIGDRTFGGTRIQVVLTRQ